MRARSVGGRGYASLHPAHVPRAPAREHARSVADLGDQHDLPARRRALEPRGVRRERVLHRRDGALRGADRDRRRHGRPARLVPARHGDPVGLDAPLRAPLGRRGALLAVGGRLGADRARLHLLLGRGRGVARRRARSDGVRRRPRQRLRARPDRLRSGDARGLGRRRLHRPAGRPRGSVRPPRRDPGRDVRRGLLPHARHRLHAGARPGPAAGDATRGRRFGRVRLARAGGEMADGRGSLHGRRRDLRVLRAPAVPARALGRPGGVPDRRARGRDRRRRADPRRDRRTPHPTPLPAAHLCPDRAGRPQRRHARR